MYWTMAYNEELIKRIKAALRLFPEVFEEKKMFGGIAYLYKGKMTVGAINEDLMVRVLTSAIETELAKPAVRPMNFTGKPMKEFVFVSKAGYKTETELDYWIALGLAHAKHKLKES